MPHRRLRILYDDETEGFGGGMVALRNLIAALDHTKYEAAIVLRAENSLARDYYEKNLPAGVPIYAIRRHNAVTLERFNVSRAAGSIRGYPF
jgi:hypothetical protein